MDNQQERFDDEKAKAWLAGFWDGEGTITIGANMDKGHLRIRPLLSIVNTHLATMEYLTTLFGKFNIPFYICSVHRKIKNPKHAKQFVIRIAGHKRCKRFLDVLESYLFTKADQAKLLREFIEWSFTLPHSWRDPKDIEKGKDYCRRISSYNTAGLWSKRTSNIFRD